jgi:membrane associated rhomboid family serine protease
MITLSLSTFLVGLFDTKHYFHLQLVPHLSRHHQYWRLISHHLAFINSSDLFVGELVLYHCGVGVERRWGSAKYAVCISFSLIICSNTDYLLST